MIEPGMFFGLGFLTAGLLALVILPLIHARAVRLTTRRVENSTPLTLAEIQADKDQLRAEFALSTRRLELTIDQLRAKSTSLMAEIGRKTATINAIKVDLTEKTAAAFAFETREQQLTTKLATTEEELTEKTERLRTAEQRLARAEARIVVQSQSMDEQASMIQNQRGEAVALRAEITSLRTQVTQLEKTTRDAVAQSGEARERSEVSERALAEARATITGLTEQVRGLQNGLATETAAVESLRRIEGELRATLAATVSRYEDEIETLTAGKTLAETGLADHQRRLADLTKAHEQALADLASIRAAEAALRQELAATITRYQHEVAVLTAGKTAAETDLADHRRRLAELSQVQAELLQLRRVEAGLREELASRTARLEAETKSLGAGKVKAEGQLAEHERRLAEVTKERDWAQAELAGLRRTETELNQRLTSLQRHYESTISALQTDKAFTEGQLGRTREERGKMQRELTKIKQEAEAGWQAERRENALLRERINEVAAEIARLAAALEGAESPIHGILAAEPAPPLAVGPEQPAQPRGSRASGRDKGSLADRIRALQARAGAAEANIGAGP